MMNMIHQIYPLWDINPMPIPGNKIIWVIIPVCFFLMELIYVTPSALRIQTSAAIIFLKSWINSYPIYKFLVQNKGSTRSKKKLPKVLKFKKCIKGLSLIKSLGVTGGKVVISILLNLKCTVILADPGSPIRNMPHSTSLVLCETNVIYPQYNT